MTYLKVDGENQHLDPFEDCKTCEGTGRAAPSWAGNYASSTTPCQSCRARHIRHLKKQGKEVTKQ